MPDHGDKKYDATPHRRQKAREEGRIPQSKDLASALVLVGALLVVLVIGEGISGNLVDFMRGQLEADAWVEADRQFAISVWWSIVYLLMQTVLPLISLTLLIALVSNLMQTGLIFLPNKVQPDLKNVNPVSGIKKMFSLSNFVRLGFGLIKVVIVLGVAIAAVMSEKEMLSVIGGMDVSQLLPFICRMVLWTSLKIGAALLVLAIFDFAFQRWKHGQDLRMTEQEMRDELKVTHGDPQVAQRRRQVQRQLAMDRVGNAVPNADAIVTNPTELAIAIRYDIESMAAPIVVAKGAGLIAQRIRRLGLEHGIPIVERKELAQVLFREVEVDHEIPPTHYAAVAEVLRYVYELKGQKLPSLEDAA